MNALIAGSPDILRITPQPSGMGSTTPTEDVRRLMRPIRCPILIWKDVMLQIHENLPVSAFCYVG